MKYFKKGDKVRVLNYSNHNDWVASMNRYIGQTITIERAILSNNERMCYKAEGIPWYWSQDWLVPVNFTKDDIKEFDVVEFRDGRISLVVDFDDGLGLETMCSFISCYHDDLTIEVHYHDPADIMKVYRPKDNLPTDKSKWKDLPLIWKREEEVKEMTVSEISEALGYTVKVVGEEDSK